MAGLFINPRNEQLFLNLAAERKRAERQTNQTQTRRFRNGYHECLNSLIRAHRIKRFAPSAGNVVVNR